MRGKSLRFRPRTLMSAVRTTSSDDCAAGRDVDCAPAYTKVRAAKVTVNRTIQRMERTNLIGLIGLLLHPPPGNRQGGHPRGWRDRREHEFVGAVQLEVAAPNLRAEVWNAIDLDRVQHVPFVRMDFITAAVRAHEVDHRSELLQ